MPVVGTGRVASGSGQVSYTPSPAAATTAASTTAASAKTSASSVAGTNAATYVQTITGTTLGNGIALYAGNTTGSNVILSFKSLIPGAGVAISETANSLTISARTSDGSGSSTFESLTDGPGTITTNAFLLGTTSPSGNVLTWSPVPSGANQTLVWSGTAYNFVALPTGTVTSVGIIGNGDLITSNVPITGAGTLSVALAPTGVSAGTYSNASIVVDAKGRVLSASSNSGFLTTVTGNADINASASGAAISLSLHPTSVIAGTYSTFTVDANGRLTQAALLSSGNVITALGFTPANVASSIASITGSADITVSNAAQAVSLALAATGVTAGTYEKVVVDAKGRILGGSTLVPGDIITALGSVIGGTLGIATLDSNARLTASQLPSTVGTVQSVAAVAGLGLSVTGGPITTSGTFTIGLIGSGVAAGTYTNLIVDATGRLTSARALSNADVIGALGVTGVVAGTYGTFAVNATGLVTFARALSSSDVVAALGFVPGAGSVSSVAAAAGTGITVSGFPITNAGTLTIGLAASGVAAGTYSNIAIDATGRVYLARAISGADVTTALGFTPANAASAGSVTQIAAVGNSAITVTGGPVTTSGTFSFSLATTTVTAGTYGTFAVDATGRLTAARALTSSDISTALGYTPGSNNGSVTSVNISGGTGITASGGPITTAGTLTVALANSGVTAGTYSNLSVDATGRIITARAVSALDISTALGFTPANAATAGSVSSVTAAAGTGITITGSPITTSGTLTIALATTSVTTGSYTNFTVDATGRLTSARALSASDVDTALGFTPANAASAGSVTSIAATASNGITVTGGPVTTAGTFAFALTTTGISAGTYTNVTYDAYGRVTAVRAINSGDVTSALGFTPGTGSITSVTANGSTGINVSGSPITGAGTLTFALAATTVIPGSYGPFTVDTTGRITNARAISSADVTNALGYTPSNGTAVVTSVGALGSGGISVTGSPITSAGAFTITLTTTGVTAGTYNNLTLDATGRVLTARTINSGDVTSALGFVPGTVASIAATGGTGISVTGSPITTAGTFSIGLTASGATAGTYSYASIVIDSFGRVTTATANSPNNGTVTSVAATGGVGIFVSGSPITSAGTLTIGLVTNGVTAGTFTNANITVDSYGRISAVANGSNSGGVTSVSAAAGTGIAVSGSPITSTGTLTIGLATNGVTPGTYTAATISVDGYGRVSAISSGTMMAGVSSVAASAGTGISVSGSPITSSGTLNIALAASGVSAGTYSNLVVDLTGRVTTARAINSSDVTTALGFTPGTGTVTSITASAGTGISVSGSPVTSAGTLTIGLATNGVAAGSYTAANITVDSYGRVSAVSNGMAPSGVTLVAASAGAGISISGSPISSTGTFNIALAASGVSPGTYSNITVDGYGRLTAARAISSADISTALGFTPGTVNSVAATAGTGITVSGSPITNTGTLTIGLATTAVTAGNYTHATFTVDATGRITSASSNPLGVSSIAIAGGSGIATSGGPITTSGTITVGLTTTGVTAGTYTNSNLVVDAYGRVTAVSNGTAGGSGGSMGLTSVDLTGDVTGSSDSSGNIAATLAASGVTAGTYSTPVFTVDSKGRVTAATTDPTVAHIYNFTVLFDSSGNVSATSTFSGLPTGWSASRDATNQITITHNLGRLPCAIAFFGLNANGFYNMKLSNGNATSQFSVTTPQAAGTAPNTFTVYGLSSTSTAGQVSGTLIIQVNI